MYDHIKSKGLQGQEVWGRIHIAKVETAEQLSQVSDYYLRILLGHEEKTFMTLTKFNLQDSTMDEGFSKLLG